MLFLCENKGFAHSMPVERTVGKPGAIAEFARAEGLQAVHVDGRDALEVYDATCQLLETVRGGHPAFLECEVFRVKPHSLSDPYRYRPKGAGRAWLDEHDPLVRLRRWMGEKDKDALDAILAETDAAVDEAARRAESQPVPDVSDAWKEVYASPEPRGRF